MDFLMSGEPEVRAAIAALAEQGYESVPVKFNADSDWHSLTWLSVEDGRSSHSASSITKTVRRVDPGAIRISGSADSSSPVEP
jgi:hypothetical protein